MRYMLDDINFGEVPGNDVDADVDAGAGMVEVSSEMGGDG